VVGGLLELCSVSGFLGCCLGDLLGDLLLGIAPKLSSISGFLTEDGIQLWSANKLSNPESYSVLSSNISSLCRNPKIFSIFGFSSSEESVEAAGVLVDFRSNGVDNDSPETGRGVELHR